MDRLGGGEGPFATSLFWLGWVWDDDRREGRSLGLTGEWECESEPNSHPAVGLAFPLSFLSTDASWGKFMGSRARDGFRSWLCCVVYNIVGKPLGLSVSPFVIGLAIILTCPGCVRRAETMSAMCLAQTWRKESGQQVGASVGLTLSDNNPQCTGAGSNSWAQVQTCSLGRV